MSKNWSHLRGSLKSALGSSVRFDTAHALGGMIGNNSCGPHSAMAGKTLENVRALEVNDLRRSTILGGAHDRRRN